MGVLETLRDAIDELATVDPAVLASREDVLELHRQLDRLQAVATRSFAAFDAGGEWIPSRARSAAHWLAWKTHMPVSTAKRELRVGRSLRSMPVAERAWLDGEIGPAHVAQLGKVNRDAAAATFQRDEKVLVDEARTLSYSGFYRALRYWVSLADPDGTEDEVEQARAKRKVHLSQSFEDMWFGEILLDPIAGAVVAAELHRIEDELFEADWAEAKQRLGHDPSILDIARTPAQRRADALLEMAVRAATAPADGRRPEPLFSVFVGYETLAGRICELANGTVVSPGSLVPWLDRAQVERVVFDSPSRVTDVGVRRRLFEGATRRAVEVRDRQCFHPSCEERAERCQVDHVEPYAWGGPTVIDNGRVACGFHNRARHRRSTPPTP